MRIDIVASVEDEVTGKSITISEAIPFGELKEVRAAATKAVDRLLAAADA